MRDFYRAGALGLRNLTYFQSFVLFCLGDLDGAEIDVDYAITPEQRLFLLGHLFGYRTGDKDEFKNFWRENAPMIQPKPIPDFKPKKRVFRMDGVVILVSGYHSQQARDEMHTSAAL